MVVGVSPSNIMRFPYYHTGNLLLSTLEISNTTFIKQTTFIYFDITYFSNIRLLLKFYRFQKINISCQNIFILFQIINIFPK